MATLDTVSDYVSAARTLLQDTASPNRYADLDLVKALNHGLLEARKLRPDLFLGRSNAVPSYTAVDSTLVVFEPMYRTALLHYMVGLTQARDDEPTQDQRATSFLVRFVGQLTTMQV